MSAFDPESRSWEDIVLGGHFIEANSTYGGKIWSWLGKEVFEELALGGLSWPLHQNFKRDEIAGALNLRRHLLLYWYTGYWKTTMLKVFEKLIKPFKTWSLGFGTHESFRGSFAPIGSEGEGKVIYTFHEPDIQLGEIVFAREMNILVHKHTYRDLIAMWIDGEIKVSLVKGSSALSKELVEEIEKKGYETTAGRLIYHPESLFVGALHEQEPEMLRKIPEAFWNRVLNLYYPFEMLDDPVLKEYVFTHTHYTRDDIQPREPLQKAWEYFREMKIEGNLPKLPSERIRKMIREYDPQPREITMTVQTAYIHAFAMQPKRHGALKTAYPELIMEEEDLDFAIERVEREMRGLKRILDQRGLKQRRLKDTRAKVEALFREGKDASQIARELNIDVQSVRYHFRKSPFIVKSGRTKGAEWKIATG